MKSIINHFSGELYFDESVDHQAQLILYSTDASVYQEKPFAVAIPKDENDLKILIQYAYTNGISLIPRAAGTSLAGQVVGNGIVVDISKYFGNIIEINVEEKWVRLQPGVIRDDLNAILKPYGLMFGPETSTSNRAMIGGMIGNNSCGLHSIVWGDTRSNLLEAKVLLSDGTETTFKALDETQYLNKANLHNLEGNIYNGILVLLKNQKTLKLIEEKFPKKSLKRRNTGYALDILCDNILFEKTSDHNFNLCKLLCGSEGTLAFVTEAKLNLMALPPKEVALVCIHCNSIQASLHANLIALKYKPMASELVDKYILDFTKGHPIYEKNRFFIQGDPEAILMVEFMADDDETLDKKTKELIAELESLKLGFAYPVIKGEATKPAWEVRKAGLGLIRNLKGDIQPVNLIEDCAVAPEDLPAYISDLQQLLKKHQVNASYYAHAGAGELHVEPMLNLKTIEGKELFRTILKETTELVKKYNGSLSGEHGDGRLRGEFIETVLGNEIFELFKKVKSLFDPKSIFNANKIIDTPAMNEFLRYEVGKQTPKFKTYFDFTNQESILKMAEKCSGSGDCRKTEVTGGTMCPSYMATKNEKDTTRARANILRNFLTNSTQDNPFDHKEIKEVMDLCLSCKGCKAECPSQVDVGKMKAEFLQHYYKTNGVPFRTWMIGNFTKSQSMASYFPTIYNFIITNTVTSFIVKKTLGFAIERSLPKVGKITLKNWFEKYKKTSKNTSYHNGKVYLFCDEFTNFNDLEVGQKTVILLEALGYEVIIPLHHESGRTYLSKGLVEDAQKIAVQNVNLLSNIEANIPILGIEPSAILTLKDEYLDLMPSGLLPKAQSLSKRCFLVDEFISNEFDKNKISKTSFTDKEQNIMLHGHCHQKAISSVSFSKKMLSIPHNYKVEVIPSGCCGMAGSFGYEKEHYEVSMKIGELVLLPEVRKKAEHAIIAAPGTSCRHQIKDGTGVYSLHPVEVLYDALMQDDFKII
jgi:FAD/FMN-containing dehydrogenase/Fe-S oxidoreductase